MKPHEIKFLLAENGSSPSEVAKICNVGRSTVTNVIAGERTSERIQTAISRIIDVPVATIFPVKQICLLKTKIIQNTPNSNEAKQ